ncbi:hypothetical protein ACKLI9_28470, partial [Klebsiella quasipneumoniae]
CLIRLFAGKKSAQIREILISESAWEEMTCLFAPSLGPVPHELVTPAGAGHVYYDFPQAAGLNFQTPHNTKHPGSARGPRPEVGRGFLRSGRIERLRLA